MLQYSHQILKHRKKTIPAIVGACDFLLAKFFISLARLHNFFRGAGGIKNVCGSGGIRTHASEETGALNQRLRPLGHATFLFNLVIR